MPQNPPELIYATSFKQASALLMVSIETLKEAKAAGCNAFRSGRVYLKEYREWIQTSPPTPENTEGNGTKISWEIARIKKQCRKFDLEFDKERGDVIEKVVLKEKLQILFQPVLEILSKKLSLEDYNACCRQLQDGLNKVVS